ncbi:MAG: 5'/3'-nucleotidase SurE [Chromatiales bacterium]|nr:5'/3'-nucleotidase SurE [Chromatiales bacterium]
MHILISNDDGYQAPGLAALADALSELGSIAVVAPDRNRSGASNSLTLDRPLRVQTAGNGFRVVDGTPTDCVHLAITGLLRDEPDMVVSGINLGPNLGDDTLYSGTVAAAIEGRFLGVPALAVSLGSFEGRHFQTAARVTQILVRGLREDPLPDAFILNVNVPDLPFDELQGIEVTRLGHRHRAEAVVEDKDPRGLPIWWVGPAGAGQDAGPGTDFHALSQHRVSVTPLQVDLTRHGALDTVGQWLGRREW